MLHYHFPSHPFSCAPFLVHPVSLLSCQKAENGEGCSDVLIQEVESHCLLQLFIHDIIRQKYTAYGEVNKFLRQS